MIIHLKPGISHEQTAHIANALKAIHVPDSNPAILVTPSALKEVPEVFAEIVESFVAVNDDIQLASRQYRPETRNVSVGPVTFGARETVVITGPCSVESEEQIVQAAELCVNLGVRILRAGAFKPRTSPYTFQGLGIEGLRLLAAMRDRYGLKIITEVRDSTHVEEIIEYADIIQIGAKSMYDHGILRTCGAARKPILLKRGFGTTLQEFVQAAEFILSGGNDQVMLCERGIRTFETKTRFTLDLCGVAWLKKYTNLPVVLDPSHAIGYAYGVADLARACTAMGVDGLLIETHPNPKVALSDASQQLDFNQFTALYESLKPIAAAVGRTIS